MQPWDFDVPLNVAMFYWMTYSALYGALIKALAVPGRHELSVEGFRHAAVLVPVIATGGSPELLFTRRTDAVESHKGQVSFPGGMMEEGDRSVVHTALRESCEEVGLCEKAVVPLGLLDDIATPSRFLITPVVGIIDGRPSLRPNAEEVAEAFFVPLEFFTNPANGRMSEREFRGKQHQVWHYDTGSHMIWGATAAIVRLLLKQMGML